MSPAPAPPARVTISIREHIYLSTRALGDFPPTHRGWGNSSISKSPYRQSSFTISRLKEGESPEPRRAQRRHYQRNGTELPRRSPPRGPPEKISRSAIRLPFAPAQVLPTLMAPSSGSPREARWPGQAVRLIPLRGPTPPVARGSCRDPLRMGDLGSTTDRVKPSTVGLYLRGRRRASYGTILGPKAAPSDVSPKPGAEAGATKASPSRQGI